jgi:hypothetical protein
MKLLSIYFFLTFVVLFSCKQTNKKNNIIIKDKITDTANYNIVIDDKIADTAKNNIIILSDKKISDFKTKVFLQYYIDDKLIKIINEDSSSMMSWYNIRNDTIDLVVHPDTWFSGTSSLLLRFINGSVKVMFLRAAHDPRPLFKLNEKDTFNYFVEVPAKKYYLQLSEIPDPIIKQPIYGFIDMESHDYYEKKENGDNHAGKDSSGTKNKNVLKFYFRSQYDLFHN